MQISRKIGECAVVLYYPELSNGVKGKIFNKMPCKTGITSQHFILFDI